LGGGRLLVELFDDAFWEAGAGGAYFDGHVVSTEGEGLVQYAA
jgi:hypothetical protein